MTDENNDSQPVGARHSDWIPHDGSGMPVDAGAKIKLKYRDGSENLVLLQAEFYEWAHAGSISDIIAYRIVKEPAAAACPAAGDDATSDRDVRLAEETILDIERAGFKGIAHPDAALYGGKVQTFARAVLRIQRANEELHKAVAAYETSYLQMSQRVANTEAELTAISDTLKDERYCHGQTINMLKNAASEEIQAANERADKATAELAAKDARIAAVESMMENLSLSTQNSIELLASKDADIAFAHGVYNASEARHTEEMARISESHKAEIDHMDAEIARLKSQVATEYVRGQKPITHPC